MRLQLFGHPFSSYTMKALIALYENQTPFEFQMLGPDHPANGCGYQESHPTWRGGMNGVGTGSCHPNVLMMKASEPRD